MVTASLTAMQWDLQEVGKVLNLPVEEIMIVDDSSFHETQSYQTTLADQPVLADDELDENCENYYVGSQIEMEPFQNVQWNSFDKVRSSNIPVIYVDEYAESACLDPDIIQIMNSAKLDELLYDSEDTVENVRNKLEKLKVNTFYIRTLFPNQ